MGAKEWSAKYYRTHKVAIKARRKVWEAENPGKRQAVLRRHHAKYRIAALDSLGGKCVRCGFADVRALQVDHVHANGRSDRAHYLCVRRFFKYVAEEGYLTGDYQCLCANCNWIKAAEQRAGSTLRAPSEPVGLHGRPDWRGGQAVAL